MINKHRKAVSKFYSRHSELIIKYNFALKTLLQQCISEPVFYGDLVYKFKESLETLIFIINFKDHYNHYERVVYSMDVMRQSACLVINQITVYSCGFLFNLTTVGTDDIDIKLIDGPVPDVCLHLGPP